MVNGGAVEHPDTATRRCGPWRTASPTSPAGLCAHSDTIYSYKTVSQIIYFILLHNGDVASNPDMTDPVIFIHEY